MQPVLEAMRDWGEAYKKRNKQKTPPANASGVFQYMGNKKKNFTDGLHGR